MRHVALPLFVLLLGACNIAPGAVPIEVMADRDDWANHVQPYVERRCGTLDCHGVEGRPFRVYAFEGLRAQPDRTLIITDAEIDDNVAAAIGVGPTDSVESHPLLLKPLPPDGGGFHHKGDPVWSSRNDPGYLCLYDWLSGMDPSADCADALAAVPRTEQP